MNLLILTWNNRLPWYWNRLLVVVLNLCPNIMLSLCWMARWLLLLHWSVVGVGKIADLVFLCYFELKWVVSCLGSLWELLLICCKNGLISVGNKILCLNGLLKWMCENENCLKLEYKECRRSELHNNVIKVLCYFEFWCCERLCVGNCVMLKLNIWCLKSMMSIAAGVADKMAEAERE